MGTLELLLVAIGLSMDAFAVAVCHGLTMKRADWKKALTVGLYFGFFQAVMPLAGYFAGSRFSDTIAGIDHWIVFALLSFIGLKMLIGSFSNEGCTDRECPADSCPDRECPGGKRPDSEEASLKPAKMLPLALATSIDALAAGVSFAFLEVSIIPAVALIGIITLILSAAGVKIGKTFGAKLKSKAELAGGIILVLIGLKILLEHLGVINL